MKKRTAVHVGLTRTANMECICHERIIERAVRQAKREFVWSARRIRFSPYKQVSYKVETDITIRRVWQGGEQWNNTFPSNDNALFSLEEGVNQTVLNALM